MSEPLIIRIYEKKQSLWEEEFDGPVEIGRQTENEEAPYTKKKSASGNWRWIVARVDEDTVSRTHLRIEPLADHRVRLFNLSKKISIHFDGHPDLPPEQSSEFKLPCVLSVGKKTLRLEWPSPRMDAPLQSLAEATRRPGQAGLPGSIYPTIQLPGGIDVDAILRWLHATVDVLHSASWSTDFLEQAAQAVVNLVGVDACWVVMLDQGTWKPEVVRTSPLLSGQPEWRPSYNVLRKLRDERKTFWQSPNRMSLDAVSLVGIRTVIAAPILDRAGQVIGALYGDRREDSLTRTGAPLTKLEATLVDLLAGGIAAGLARVEQEKAAVSAQVRFEQFFTPTLSRQLAAHPDLLKGQDLDVTVLFCDIRGFSRTTRRLGPPKTLEWLNDVLDNLSDCVLASGGVVVDYVGDEVMTMWGAPESQPDHAARACRTALEMLARLPALNERWLPVLGEPFSFGIGINTGVARVGNTGSRQKFKYGPLGNTVNLASRVQGAGKYLKADVLLTGSTRQAISTDFKTRRLATVRVVNIDDPIELCEMVPPDHPGWPLLKDRYEEALKEFDSGSFRAAVRILGNLLMEHPGDGPSLVLLARAVACLVDEPVKFDPVWVLPGK
jgi:adenylate cyclase